MLAAREAEHVGVVLRERWKREDDDEHRRRES
jgi:hypothetical protein